MNLILLENTFLSIISGVKRSNTIAKVSGLGSDYTAAAANTDKTDEVSLLKSLTERIENSTKPDRFEKECV